MKRFLLTLGLVLISTDAFAASTALPMRATIINLTSMPLAEAIAFCDTRNMECPALRMKLNSHDQDPRENAGDADLAETYDDTLHSDEAGPYYE